MSNKRDYLSEEKQTSFEFGSELPQKSSLSEIFNELTRRLKTKFDIDRGVFIVRTKKDDKFSAISTWNEGKVRSNISINVSIEPSLFEKVAENGIVFTDSFTGEFSGNFFERRLLLDDGSQSYVLQPLKHEGQVVGMLGYSSIVPTAFSTFEEGILDNVAGELGEIISKKYSS